MSRNYRKNYRKKASLKHRIIELVILLVIMIAVSAAGAIYDRYQNENKVMPDGQMTVHFIDVGQGDSILIQCGTHAMLIDAGDNSCGTKVQAYLKNKGVAKLDYVIGTHPDSDHIGGLDVIIYKFDCENVMMPDCEKKTNTYRDVISAMKEKNYINTLPEVGKKYKLGDAEFTILAPSKKYEDANNNSISIILQYGDRRFLFTGDAEEEEEQDIVNAGISIDCDVYKAGHHGSRTSSSEELLNAASPAFAVISCGEGNSYGHPHARTLNEFRQRGIQVFRTDEQGTIEAVTDGVTIKWNCSPSETWKTGN